MLGNREEIETLGTTQRRIVVEALRFLKENEPEEFEKRKQQLEGTDLWNQYQKEYE